eukprot:TRINITY_DN4332_c0_g1_i1.p1 TRINITY_DN4332_c0_g1~~TRINITY_DN4332_c0_g1_i1.p1  ORF type:complete len:487 (-),score=123.19 TRINITY_DN4332_c0_g1_i1:76-1317(-)
MPSPRSGHSAVVYDDKMFIFGGRDGNTFKNDVFVFDLEEGKWSEVATTGAKPLARYGHKAVAYDNKMLVFGGHASHTYLNDLLELDLDTMVWKKLETVGTPPSPRWQFSLVIYRGNLVVFGGCDSSAFSNEMYMYDVENRYWRHVKIDAYCIPPAPRLMHGAAVINDKMLVYGGQCVDSIKNDVFEFDFDTVAWNYIGVAEGRSRRHFACIEVDKYFLALGGFYGKSYNDVIQFEYETSTWSTLETTGTPPSPRAGHTAVLYNNKIYVFGGLADDGAQNDLTTLSLRDIINDSPTLSTSPIRTPSSFSPRRMTPIGTSPIEASLLHRFKNLGTSTHQHQHGGSGSSGSHGSQDREFLGVYNREESPLITLYRAEIMSLQSQLEECQKENLELKREIALLKEDKSEENNNFLLY